MASRRSALLMPLLLVVVFGTKSEASATGDDVNAIVYRVDILEKPVLDDQAETGSSMSVVSKYGQKYRCRLPETRDPDEDAAGRSRDDPAYGPSLSDIGVLLKPLETGPCLVKTKDWWTYEFCYGKHIQQYHLEDNKIVSPVIVLGTYHSEYDWNNDSKEDETSRNRLRRYHSQYYSNGSKCEVTGILRKAEVRFLCEDGAGDYVSQVEEPESCRYVITVRTTRVCHHPYLRPPPTNAPRPVTCNPILTSEQYERFRRREEEAKELFEERRKAWLSKQEERLVELKERDGEDRSGTDEKAAAFEDQGTNPTGVRSESEDDEDEEDAGATEGEGEPKASSVEKLVERLQMLGKALERKMDEGNRLDSEEDAVDPTAAAKEEMFGELLETLRQLHKAERDLDDANEALWHLQNTIQNREQTRKDAISSKDRSEEVVTQKAGLRMEPATSEEQDGRTTQEAKKAERKKAESGIERALREHLERGGTDPAGKKVEVKIITAAYLDEDKDDFRFANDEDADRLQTVLVKLLAGNEEAAEQAQRQKMLERNYEFVWKDEKETVFDEEEDG